MDGAAQARTLPELVRSKFQRATLLCGGCTHQIDDEKERSGVVDRDCPIYAKAFDLQAHRCSHCAPGKETVLLHEERCQ